MTKKKQPAKKVAKEVPDFLTINQAAEALNVSRQRVHKLLETYNVTTLELSPKLFLIPKAELSKIPPVRKPGPKKF